MSWKDVCKGSSDLSIASVGLYAIQFASLFGLDVVTTCSPNNNDLVRSHGAKYVFDYREDNVIGRIQEATPNLQYTFDTIGNSTSSSMASRALSREGNLCTVRPGKANTENVVSGTHITGVLVWTVFLKDHSYGHFKWPVRLLLLSLGVDDKGKQKRVKYDSQTNLQFC